MSERCAYPHCRSDNIDVIYLDKLLCPTHWSKVADENYRKSNAALRKLKLPTRTPYKPKPTPKQEPKAEEEPRDVCTFCNRHVGQGRLCAGCEHYVCISCNEMDPLGQHEVEYHQQSGML